jgi:hypothetical protein
MLPTCLGKLTEAAKKLSRISIETGTVRKGKRAETATARQRAQQLKEAEGKRLAALTGMEDWE